MKSFLKAAGITLAVVAGGVYVSGKIWPELWPALFSGTLPNTMPFGIGAKKA